MLKPYCFVLMPFGKKADDNGRLIDFDDIYKRIMAPAILDADLEPIRADEEIIGGIIHKPMFERLMICDFAIADLTTANPNVLYELGVRHGVRPHSTVLTFGRGMRLPFDVAPLRGLPYEIDSLGQPADPEEARKALSERLRECRDPKDDSPVYQLISDLPRPDIPRLKSDTFRNMVEYSRTIKARLREARERGSEAVAEIERGLVLKDADPAIVVDLLLSYRAVEAWESMEALVNNMSALLGRSVLVQEQLGFALNRLGFHTKAEHVLLDVIEQYGPSSETNGLLGRVYKDLYEQHQSAGLDSAARGYLQKAINTYLQGFEADWRDAYPGVNAVTLMELTEPPDPKQRELIPVVRYAVQRRLASKHPDYWDYATLLELAVLDEDEGRAEEYLALSLAAIREPWEPKTTARNLALIRRARQKRQVGVEWVSRVEQQLQAAGDNRSVDLHP